MRYVLALALALVSAACGSSPSPVTPSTPSSPSGGPPPSGAPSTAVRLLDEVTDAALAGVTATVNSQTMSSSDATGHSVVWASQAGQHTVTFAGPSVTTRTTSLKIPAGGTTLALIPGTFDRVAFNQMFRPSQRLQRWTSAPPLVVLTRAVKYESNFANTPVVLDEEMSVADRQQLVRDLTDGFLMLTDRRLGEFSSVTFESPAPGSTVNVMRTGVILVARSRGLTAGSTYWGFGRWAVNGSGAVVAGNIMIDADFDGPASAWPQYRRCLRIHELGHALGYDHVTTGRASVMNQSARLEPNEWDLQAVHIAFQRQPGNTDPDNDPSGFSANARTGAVTWSAPRF